MVDGSRTTRFTRYLVETHAFKADKMVVVDVGARGGFSPAWDVLQDQVRLIGFEPDTEECDRLNADAGPVGPCSLARVDHRIRQMVFMLGGFRLPECFYNGIAKQAFIEKWAARIPSAYNA